MSSREVVIDQIMGDYYIKQQASNRTVESLIQTLYTANMRLQENYNKLKQSYDELLQKHPEDAPKEEKIAEQPQPNT